MFFDDKYNDPRFERPEYMIVWGSNPLVSNPAGYFGHQIIDMMKMGTKLIVVDPQITWMGSRAEHVLQLRPGTDAALAIGMLKVIVDEDIYDKEFVEKWVYGFDWLVERINQYSYEEIEKLTQVPTEQMRTVARAYATADGTGRNCSIFMGVAMEMQTDALSDIQAVLSLIAITATSTFPAATCSAPRRPSRVRGATSRSSGLRKRRSRAVSATTASRSSATRFPTSSPTPSFLSSSSPMISVRCT